MSEAQTNDSAGFKGRAKFAALVGVVVAVTATHLAGIVRVHNLPFIEGLPEEFHPKILKSAAIAFAALFIFALPLAFLLPRSAHLLWQRLLYSLGSFVAVLASMVASREMTELLEGTPRPSWAFIAASTFGVAAFTLLIAWGFDLWSRTGLASRTAWGFAMVVVVSVSYFMSLNAALPTFDEFGPSLRYLILGCATLTVALGVIIMYRTSRWWSLGLLAFFLFLLATSLPFAFSTPSIPSGNSLRVDDTKPRQIILLTVDTLRADVLGYSGGEDTALTPNFDALAADSVIFTNATTYAPWTLPSMGSLFTGEDPRVHHCTNVARRLPDRFKTPAEYFSGAGYHTKAVIHNAFLKDQYRFSQGFDEFTYVELIELGFEINPLRRSPLLRSRRHNFSSTTMMITVEVLRYMRRMKDRPYFLWIHYFDPHKPYIAPERFVEEMGRVGKTNAREAVRRITEADELEFARIEKSRYKSEVRYVDECIGRIMNELKSQGIYDSSLIAFTSDHGEEFYEHGGYTHSHTLYNELLHVPLLWKLPNNQDAGRIIETRVPMAGVRATLLETMDFDEENPQRFLNPPSLMPFIRGDKELPILPPLLAGAIDPSLPAGDSIIADEWKLIERIGRAPELYNLRSDPLEKSNLYQTNSEQAEGLKLLLELYKTSFEQRRSQLGMSPDENSFVPDAETQNELRDLGYLN